ncbi:MAG TPA: alpha/beta hydrolase [Beijerinckiaceae bacterium]|jgi:pimeloyl-ACP methyl ester carboxylesterase
MPLADEGFLDVGGARLEYRMIGLRPDEAPTIVMLHEGLGSASLWGDFPERLAQRTKAGVFAYSRAGYGRSSPVPLPRPLDYMQREATQALPKLLDAVGFRRGILLGHSDGASIAAVYAGSVQDHRVRGLVLMAPHFFVEDFSLREIERAKERYESGDLREKLARHHADVDVAFRGWNDAWLDPDFPRVFDIVEPLAYIRVPVLIVQGEDDPYGTVRQIEAAEEECYCPVETVLLPACGHAPHRDKPAETLEAVGSFIERILVLHGEARMERAA